MIKKAAKKRGLRRGVALALAVVGLLLGALFLGFRFDEGPMWHADVVAVRDAACDIVARTPSVLVIGDPVRNREQSAALEQRLADRGLRVRYTGDDVMTAWERRYVAVYWSVVGRVFDPPVG